MKMKKIAAAILFGALSIAGLKADYALNNGLITISGSSDLTLTITRDFGGNKGFGYYKYDPVTGQRGELISIGATQGESFTISGLQDGDVISFYIEHAGQGTIYGDALGKKDGYNLSSLGFDADTGAESMNIKFQGNNNGVQFSLSSAAPAGQPMPGVIATSVMGALCCGALVMLRRRNKASAQA